MEEIKFLNAEADNGDEEILSFSDNFIPLIRDFLRWSKERHITQDRIDFAWIFQNRKWHRKAEKLCALELTDDNGCILIPKKGDNNER